MTTDAPAAAGPARSRGLVRAIRAVQEADLSRRVGRVSDLIGLIIEATGVQVEIGEVCMVGDGRDRVPVACEVVGFRGGRTLLMPLGELHGIGPGTSVHPTGSPFRVAVGEPLLGRVIDGLGAPLDGFGPPSDVSWRSTEGAPPDPLTRPRIADRVSLGVRALDTLVPCGRGQRHGIFAGSGVGKSS
jgi:flagellum-specific ATP synthase